MKLGIITDTHGVIHPKVFDIFQGVDEILHAGDIDTEEILDELQTIAPVNAVLGNVDPYELHKKIPPKRILTFEGKTILLIHQALDGQSAHRDVKKELDKQKIDIVVFGHTHMPFNQEINGVLFFNPGGAGKRRFNYPLGVGIIEIKDGNIKANIETLY